MAIQVFRGAARQRARLLGELQALRGRLNELASLPERIAELERKIASYNAVLAEQGVDIDPDDYAPVTPTPRRAHFKHGQCSAACLDCLRNAKCPLSTLHVLDGVVKALGIRFASTEDYYKTRKVVAHQLAVYARQRILVRLPDLGTCRSDVAYWSLPQYANEPRRA